jgi:formamidopyrimidine-DNA glycosylase
MPELPDVEGFRRYLARHAQGQKIVRVEVPDRMLLRNRTPRAVNEALKRKSFAAPIRHGKWLIAPTQDGPDLLLHFGMTGLLAWTTANAPRHPHDCLIFITEEGELRYNNVRRLGGVWLAQSRDERDAVTGPLGPDAASIDRDRFEELLDRRRGGIKAALMDQRLIAGVGNLLSDEILWRARVHAATPVHTLTTPKRAALYEALRRTVGESLRYGRVPHGSRWLTRVRDDRNAGCPRCGTALRKATIAGRTTCWCPRCQRTGRH